MLDRTKAPLIHHAHSVAIPDVMQTTLTNGTQLLVVNEGDEDLCRIDIIFQAGSRYQQQKLEALGAFTLITEGTAQHTSQQISEHFDFLGSFVMVNVDRDFARVTAFSLNKHLPKTLEMLEEIIKQPNHPESEVNVWQSRGKQALTVEFSKTSTLARLEFFKNIFGSEHPYGTFAHPSDYDLVKRNNMSSFYADHAGSAGTTILLSGKISQLQIDLVEQHLGKHPWGRTEMPAKSNLTSASNNPDNHFVKKADAVQSAIKVGRELFNRTHSDYAEMIIVNTILGGYFGSRLMKNIREDKGYTYGIGSSIATFRDSGFLIISTEVGAPYTEQTLKEIEVEIEKLKNEKVGEEELSLVRSFLMGDVLRSFNGPFAIADNIISLLNFNNLDFTFYQKQIHAIQSITPKRIMELANHWLDQSKLVRCVAGPSSPF